MILIEFIKFVLKNIVVINRKKIESKKQPEIELTLSICG